MKYTVLYNPMAGNGSGYKAVKHIKHQLRGFKLDFCDLTKIVDYDDFFANLPKENRLIVCGGDGTLNRFINNSRGAKLENEIFYCPGGSGNDFLKDISTSEAPSIVHINKYLRNIPYAVVKGKKYFFLNGVGIGLDGYCCEEGEKSRGNSKRPINYKKIAVEGLLYGYKPKNAIVTVDGVKHIYKKVWFVSTMNGRYFGGGMMPTPNQDRLNPEHSVSVMVAHSAGIPALVSLLPKFYKGTHTSVKKYCEVLEGREIIVEFSAAAPVQIDGEVVPGVLKYEVYSGKENE